MTQGTLVRRALVAASVVGLTVVDATAFQVDFHAEITRDGLGRVARLLPARVQEALRRQGFTGTGFSATGFSDEAIEEIVDANRAKDLGECGTDLGPNAPAVPCAAAVHGGETANGLYFLSLEPAEEHFDAETIQLSSNKVYIARNAIRDDLLKGQPVAARKALGGALHAIQDFYAHSNWVELGLPGIEKRLGTELDAFKPNVSPRIADKNEPMCVEGERLLTQLTAVQQSELVKRYQEMERQGISTGDISSATILKVLKDRPLTTGYFYLSNPENGPLLDDPAVITMSGKCRHGWEVPGTNGKDNQAGINKDRPYRPNFAVARQRASDHTLQFVLDVINDRQLNADPDYTTLILGLLGRGVIEGATVGVPGAPNGDSWDTAIGSVLRFLTEGTQGLKNIQPDIQVCIESDNVRMACAKVCDDADWSNEANAYLCKQPIGVPSESVTVHVREMDFGEPRRVIADFRVLDPRKCNPTYTSRISNPPAPPVARPGTLPFATPGNGACRLQLDAQREIWIQFQQRGEAPVEPPVLVPPSGGTGGAPPISLGPPPPTAPGAGQAPPPTVTAVPPPPVPPVGPVSPAPAPALPPLTPPVAPTSPTPTSPTPTAPAPATTLTAPTAPATAPVPGGTASPRLPTAAEIDAILNLRDGNSCTGSDAFVPPGTSFIDSPLGQQLGPARAAQLYQMAAFAMAIADPAVKAKVLSAIQSRVGDDAFFGAMTQVIGDVQQSRALVAAYQALAQNVVSRITATGLDRLLTPPRAAVADVGTWILKMLTSDALVSDAVGMMAAGPSGLSAECALNELAKDGFAATVGAR